MDQVTSITVFVVAFALCLPLLTRLMKPYPRLLRVAKYIIFGVYVAANLYETILFRTPNDAIPVKWKLLWSYRASLSFETLYGEGWRVLIQSLLNGTGVTLRVTNLKLLEEILLNILLYIPLGYLLPFLWPRLAAKRGAGSGITGWRVVLIGFTASLLTELTQLTFRIGWFELDDIMNNTLGCMLGFVLYRYVVNRAQRKGGEGAS